MRDPGAWQEGAGPRSTRRVHIPNKVMIEKDKSGTSGKETPKQGPHLLKSSFPIFLSLFSLWNNPTLLDMSLCVQRELIDA